jgi:hypothetical protein
MEAGAMPFDHGLRLNNRQRIANARVKPIKANKNHAIDGAEGLFLRSGSSQNPSISQLTLPPETITSCYLGIRHTEFQPHSGRHLLFGKGCLFETANLSDFANAVWPSSLGVVTFETSALKSDAVRTFIDDIAPKQIKKTTASQTVLITQSPQG